MVLPRPTGPRRRRFALLAAWIVIGGHVLHGPHAVSAAPLFAQAYVPFDAGSNAGYPPTSFAAGDLNGDGRLDLVMVPAPYGYRDSSVAVVLGIGNDTFGPRATYRVGGQPRAAAIGDLNADGKPDVAVTTTGPISVLLGNGDGTLGANTDFPIDGTALAIGDLNGDGKPDLVVVSQNSSTVSVLPGFGNGTFGPKTDFSVGGTPSSVALADLDGDGRLDVAVAFGAYFNGALTGGVSVLLGVGNGTLQPRTDYADPLWPKFVAIADLNGDGHLDLAVCNQASEMGGPSSTAAVSVLLGNGDGTFGPKSDVLVGRTAGSLAIADLNGDGHPDLAVARPNFQTSQFDHLPGALSVLLGNGDGTFASQRDYLSPGDIKWVAAADLDGDGFPDLACTYAGTWTGAVLVGNGDGSFRTPPRYDGLGAGNVRVEDLNGDGILDLATSDVSATHGVSVWLGNPGATFGPRADYGSGQLVGTFVYNVPPALVVADLNGDGTPDLAYADYNRDSLRVLTNLGSGSFASQLSLRTGDQPIGLAAGDLNGDGRMDLVVANEGSGATGSISVLLGTANGSFAPRTDYALPDNAEAEAVADLDGDGKPDVAAATYFGAISIWHGNGDGTLGTRSDFTTAGYPVAIAVGDLNGDGVPDLVVGCADPEVISVLLGTGGGGFSTNTDYIADPGINSVAIGDVNGDGIPDIVDNSVSVLLGTGDGTFGPPTWYGANPGGGIATAIADLDGDGRPDLVCTAGSVMILQNTGGRALGVRPRSTTLPRDLQLEPPRPNPSRSSTELTVLLPAPARLETVLFDVGGRRIRTLRSGANLPAGRHRILWDGRDDAGNLVPAGIYLLRARAGEASAWRKLVRAR